MTDRTYSIDALKRGERAAWRSVYEAHADAVYHHALYRLGGAPEAAEDATQEVFVRAIESIATFRDGGAGLQPWLNGILSRIVARRARSLRPEAARPLSLDTGTYGESQEGEAPGIDPPDPKPLADDGLIREEERRLTGAALADLAPHWERALRWKYCEDLSVAEIASRLEMTPKAAESLLSRARAAFREAYERLAGDKGNGSAVMEPSDE